MPRAILAWIQSASLYEGEVPGVPQAFVSFQKSDVGFSGSVGLGDDTYKFEGASLFHLAASVAVAMGVEYEEVSADLRDLDIEKLGKSIDLLAKARRAAVELQKGRKWMGDHPGDEDLSDAEFERKYDCDRDEVRRRMAKAAEGPGPAHAPNAPAAPTPPTPVAPQPGKASLPKLPKPPSAAKPGKAMKLTRSETTHACPSCGQAQFQGNVFRGCICFRDLAKSATVQDANENDVTIKLDTSAWDGDALLTFLESIGRK